MKILYSRGSVLLAIIAVTYLMLYRFHRLKILDFNSMVSAINATFITSCQNVFNLTHVHGATVNRNCRGNASPMKPNLRMTSVSCLT